MTSKTEHTLAQHNCTCTYPIHYHHSMFLYIITTLICSMEFPSNLAFFWYIQKPMFSRSSSYLQNTRNLYVSTSTVFHGVQTMNELQRITLLPKYKSKAFLKDVLASSIQYIYIFWWIAQYNIRPKSVSFKWPFYIFIFTSIIFSL